MTMLNREEMIAAGQWPEPGSPEYPDPEPAHPRDTPDGSAMTPQPEDVEQLRRELSRMEQRLVDVRRSREDNRTRRLAAEEELEKARKLIGHPGPFVVVKIGSLNAVTDGGQAEVRVAFGGGVTRHMLGSVLSIGMQAVQESLPPVDPTRGQVRATVAHDREGREVSPDELLCDQPGCPRYGKVSTAANCGAKPDRPSHPQRTAGGHPRERDAIVRPIWPVPGDLRRTPEGELQEWDGRNWWSVSEPPAPVILDQ